MSAYYYRRDGSGPVPYEVLRDEGGFSGRSDTRVARTTVGESDVSTVFLGLDHNWGDGRPLIFETMVFGGKYDQECERYSTEAEAVAGHARWVATVSEPIPSEVEQFAALIDSVESFYGNSLTLAEALLAKGVQLPVQAVSS